MQRDRLLTRLKGRLSSRAEVELSKPDVSPLEFRVGYAKEMEGLVPVMVRNQSIPVFVSPEVYLDIRHLEHIAVAKNRHENPPLIKLRFNSQGVSRFNALVNDSSLPSLVLYFNQYPLSNVHLSCEIDFRDVELDTFESLEEAVFVVDSVNEAKRKK